MGYSIRLGNFCLKSTNMAEVPSHMTLEKYAGREAEAVCYVNVP